MLSSIWNFFHLPPIGAEMALHIDLASAFIAMLALIFSIWTWRHQTRIRIAAMRMQRDNDLIRWIDSVIDTIVEVEFFLRSWTSSVDAAQFAIRRDGYLAKLAAAIDKGRLYFPTFTRDFIEAESEPGSNVVGGGRQLPLHKFQLPLLDDLVEIYDVTKDVDFQSEAAVKKAQYDLITKKRDFVVSAQSEVEPERRLFAERKYRPNSRGSHP